MPWDDGVERSTHEERLNCADLRDQMAQPYPIRSAFVAPPANNDQGASAMRPSFARCTVIAVKRSRDPEDGHLAAQARRRAGQGDHREQCQALQAVSDEVDRLPKRSETLSRSRAAPLCGAR